jgi:aminopeptidase-like protein
MNNIVRKASKKSIATKLEVAKKMFRNSEALRLCLGELDDIKEMGVQISQKRVADLIDYYKNIFPEDYALCLTDNLIKEKEDNSLENYKDFNLSDEALMSVENMLGGNRDPYSPMYDGGDDMGYDYISHMRGFDGVTPEQYELPKVQGKKKD